VDSQGEVVRAGWRRWFRIGNDNGGGKKKVRSSKTWCSDG